MKVLLLGDFSTVHKNLKKGLNKLGIEAYTATHGDGWKKINADINLGPTFLPGRIRNYLAAFELIVNKKIDFEKFDLIQLINPTLIPRKIFLSQLINKQLKQSSAKVCLAACGNDYYYYQLLNELKYNPLTNDQSAIKFYEQLKLKEQNDFVLDMATKVIPNSYSYWRAYQHSPKVSEIVPFPLSIDTPISTNFSPNRKLRIYHGVTRPKFKGSEFIQEALRKVEQHYPREVEVLITKKLRFDDFTEALSWCDIYVDQANSYGYGYAALHALSKGKIVLSGFEKIAHTHLVYEEDKVPIINIMPDSDLIFTKLEEIIDQKKTLTRRFEYIEEFLKLNHDCKKIALKYLELW